MRYVHQRLYSDVHDVRTQLARRACPVASVDLLRRVLLVSVVAPATQLSSHCHSSNCRSSRTVAVCFQVKFWQLRCAIFVTTSPWRGVVVADLVCNFVMAFVTLWPCNNMRHVVAERPRDASCLSVVSFSSTIHRTQLLVTSASDLPLRTITFSSVLYSLSCSSTLAVINKIHLCVAVCAVNCTVHRRSCWSHCSSHRSEKQILVENRDFCLPHRVSVGILLWRLVLKN